MSIIDSIKDLFSKLLTISIVLLIAFKITSTKNVKIPKKEILTNNTKTKQIKQTKSKPEKSLVQNKEEKLDQLVEKLNAHIDEQTYLLSHYLENDFDAERIQILFNNLSDIRQDAQNKKVTHLVDLTQIEELESQLQIYQNSLIQKNKNL